MAQEKIAQTVDVHTHIIIPEYVEVLKAHGAELEETFLLPAWDAERHIAFMDSASIRTAVLTMPAPQPYYDDTEESAKCIRRVNEVSAKVKQQYPGRLKFCAAQPLPAVDAAIPSLLTISSSSTGPCPSMYLMTLHLLPSYAEPSSTMPGRLTLHESPTVTSGLY